MSLPDKRIKKIKLPGDVDGNKTYEIVPERLGKGGYAFELPTLTADSVAATQDYVLGLVGGEYEVQTALASLPDYNEDAQDSVPMIKEFTVEILKSGFLQANGLVNSATTYTYTKYALAPKASFNDITRIALNVTLNPLNFDGKVTLPRMFHTSLPLDEEGSITAEMAVFTVGPYFAITFPNFTNFETYEFSDYCIVVFKRYVAEAGGDSDINSINFTAQEIMTDADLASTVQSQWNMLLNMQLRPIAGWKKEMSEDELRVFLESPLLLNTSTLSTNVGIWVSTTYPNNYFRDHNLSDELDDRFIYHFLSFNKIALVVPLYIGNSYLLCISSSDEFTGLILIRYLNDSVSKSDIGTAAACNIGTSAGNVPVLDSNGKLNTSVLPALAVSETFTAASKSAMLALTAQVGDICIRTDESKTYILANTPASTEGNWKLLEHPADAVQSVNGKTGTVTIGFSLDSSASTSTGAKQYVESILSTGASGNKQYLHFGAGSTPSRDSFTYATGSFSTAASMNFNTGTNTDTPYISAISGGSAVSPTTKYLHKSTTSVVTGISGGSGSLTSGTESGTGKIKYVEDVTHTAASLTGTTTFNTDAIKAVTLSASGTSTDGPIYVQSITGSAPSLTGTKTFITGYPSFSGGSGKLESYDALTGGTKKVSDGTRIQYISDVSHTAAGLTGTTTFVTGYPSFSGGSGGLTSNDTSADGIAYIASASHTAASLGTPTTASAITGIAGGSGSLEAYDAVTGGTKKVANGTRIGYVADVSHTAASLTGTTTFVTGYDSFSGGSGSLTSNSTAGTDGIEYIKKVSFENGVLTLESAYLHHSHSGASLGDASTGTVGISGGSISKTTYYLEHSHTGASSSATDTFVKDYPNFSGGSASHTTKYLHHSHSGASLGTASTGTVGISGGSISKTTYYLDHAHTAAGLGTASTGTVGISGGNYTATSKYMKVGTTAASTGTVGISGGSITPTIKYLTHTHIGASASGTTDAITGLAANASAATGDITFVESVSGGSAVSATTKYMKFIAPVLSTSTAYQITGVGSAPSLTLNDTSADGFGVITSVSGGTTSATTKYLKVKED